MQDLTNLQNTAEQQVYGFLCQKTNVFYAFESFEAYQEFLQWLERENALGNTDQMEIEDESSVVMPSDS